MFKNIMIICLLLSCSTIKTSQIQSLPPKEFSQGELILASRLLNKIFDREMAPIECVPDIEEAGLLLRTMSPRMEVIEDDMDAMMDDPQKIKELIHSCDQNCTCSFVDEIIREHQVSLIKSLRKKLSQKISDKEGARCMNYAQSTFCQSELFKTLNQEKEEFTFEADP